MSDFNGRVLVIGSGGREHALAWKLAQSDKAEVIFVAPGNPGTAEEDKVQNVDIEADDITGLKDFALENNIGLTVVGPEVPLVAGLSDEFDAAGLKVFGPNKQAAQLEGSKDYTKKFCDDFNLPTAAYETFTELEPAVEFANKFIEKYGIVVIKADGLAAGKGVIIPQDKESARETLEDMLEGNKFGASGSRVVIEEFLEGEELSMIFMIDENGASKMMAPSQDHKRRFDQDKGPNTGGMGAYSPVPHLYTPELGNQVMDRIIQPTIDGLKTRGIPFKGFLYAGLKLTKEGPKLIEYNVRFGDPETQPVLYRLKSDFLELCLAGADGRLAEVSDPVWDERIAVGTVLAAASYPESSSKGVEIELPDLSPEEGKIFHAGTALSDGKLVTNGGRLVCSVALGNKISEATKASSEILERVKGEGIAFRKDIGYHAIAHE